MLRTGLFGGTFAPPHLGHYNAAKMFLSYVELDELIIMPTFIPPHKQQTAGDNPGLRYKMCKSLFSDLPLTYVSDYEITKKGISYTIETIEYLKKQSSDRCIYLLCGTDMFLSLDTWYRADDIFKQAEIVCVPRYDNSYSEVLEKKAEYYKKYEKNAVLLPEDPFVISSTDIRRKINERADVSQYLSDGVIEIIENEGLYL